MLPRTPGEDNVKEHCYYVYLLASRKNGTLYVGVTNELWRRVTEHKNGMAEGFSRKYHVHRLVWYESHGGIAAAIAREKRLKKWNRAWKVALIEEHNKNWTDLYWQYQHRIDVENDAFKAAVEKAAAQVGVKSA